MFALERLQKEYRQQKIRESYALAKEDKEMRMFANDGFSAWFNTEDA